MQAEADNCMKRHHDALSDLSGSVECPLCRLEMPKMTLTGHFATAHKDSGQQCCVECLALVKNFKRVLRKHITTLHQTGAGKSGKPFAFMKTLL